MFARVTPLRVLGLGLLLTLTGCDHSEPYATEQPEPLGPPSSALPRQLTFNPGDDRAPNFSGSRVTFHRLEPRAAFKAPCVAILPPDGGTLEGEFCAPPPSPADTFVSSWLEPALSPDGTRLAFVWRRSPRVSALSAWSYDLVVSAVDSPAVPLASRTLVRWLPGDRLVNTALELEWTSPTGIRFLAALDSVFKVKGGGAARFTDTVTVPRALMEFDLSTDTIRVVPGGDEIVAWAPGASTLWIVPDSNPTLLLALGPDGSRTAGGTWPVPVTDIAESGGLVAATAALDVLFWLLPTTGQGGQVLLPGSARRLSAGASGRVVLEIERRGGDEFGAPANLWLFALPGGQTVR